MLRTNNLEALKLDRLPSMARRANLTRRLKTKARDEQRMRVWRQGPQCAVCGVVVAYELFELDHVQPLCDGGSTGDANTQVMCFACHAEKSSQEKSERAKRRYNYGFDREFGTQGKG